MPPEQLNEMSDTTIAVVARLVVASQWLVIIGRSDATVADWLTMYITIESRRY